MQTSKNFEGRDHLACQLDVPAEEGIDKLRQLVEKRFMGFDTLMNTMVYWKIILEPTLV
jgi:hypothetical protein